MLCTRYAAGRIGRLAAAFAFATLVAAPQAHAVTVSPAVVYLDHATREATITLYNGGKSPEEISVGFAYGLPVADANGATRLALSDSAPAGEPSAVPWLSAFPRRLVLQPGESQLVRILAHPPVGLSDGEYWARVVVSGLGAQPPIEQRDGARVMRIRIGSRVVAGLHYRKGRLTTGLAVRSASVSTDSAGVRLRLDLARSGTAAYLGTLVAHAVDAGGTVLGSSTERVTVYRDILRGWGIPVPAELRGRVVAVRYTIEAARDDLPQGTALSAPALSGTVPLRGRGDR